MGLPAGDDDHGGDRGSRSEDRVFERAQPEDADPRLARRKTCAFERETVDDEAASNHEHAEARSDDGTCTAHAHLRPAFDTGNLAIRDDVTEVGGDLHPERRRQPDPVDAGADVDDLLESRGPRNADQRSERKRGTDSDQQEVL